MNNNYFLMLALLFLGNVAIGQKQQYTIVLIKHDFQENTFEKKEQKDAKKSFDILSQKIDSTLNVLKSDTTLGLIFVKEDAKNVNVIFSFIFSAAQKNKTRSYIPAILVTDKSNDYKIGLASWVIVPEKKDKTMADVVQFVNKELQYNALEKSFTDYFCQYTTPNLGSQKSTKLQYDSVMVVTSFKLKAPTDIISKSTSIIVKNALIRQHLKNEQNTSITKNIYITNHKTSSMSEGEIAVCIDIKVIRNKYIFTVKLMESKQKVAKFINYPEMILAVDKTRIDIGDYTEVNYKINIAMADLCNNVFFKNKK